MRIFLNCTEFTTKVNDVVWCPYTRIACVLHFISDIIIDDKNHHPLWHGMNKPSCHYCPLDILVFCFTKPKSLSYKIDYKSQLPSNNSRLNIPPHEYINTYIYLNTTSISHLYPIFDNALHNGRICVAFLLELRCVKDGNSTGQRISKNDHLIM